MVILHVFGELNLEISGECAEANYLISEHARVPYNFQRAILQRCVVSIKSYFALSIK